MRVVVDPDACFESTLSFSTGDATLIAAPADQSFGVHRNEVTLTLTAGAQTGRTSLTVFADVFGAAGPVSASCQSSTECTLPGTQCHGGRCLAATDIEVYVGTQPAPTYCGTAPTYATASTPSLDGGQTLTLPQGIASITLPAGADAPNAGSFVWHVDPFAASVSCTDALTISGFETVGPAVTFGPASLRFPRDLPLSIPIDPASLSSEALQRHVQVAYSGPGALAPRVVPVSDLRLEAMPTTQTCTSDASCQATYVASRCGAAQVCEQWRLRFKAPRLGTYQAVISSSAGTTSTSRHLTYRALVGLSTGATSAASVGTRHHELFDVIAPLGGPASLTFMSNFVSDDLLGGFRTISSGTTLNQIQLTPTSCTSAADCQSDETCLGGKCQLLAPVRDVYAHAESFNTWWLEVTDAGTAGFPRDENVRYLRDLSLAFGNLTGENLSAGGSRLPPGVRPSDPSVVGSSGNCAVTVDPVCPLAAAPMPWPAAQVGAVAPSTCTELSAQQSRWQTCGAERCASTLTLNNFYDLRHNPDGIFPVITVCDGAASQPALSPYAATWSPGGNQAPLEIALAVDFNGNGTRDELEPLITQPHEPFSDVGTDGVASASEPNYAAGTNEDPAGDDYDPQFNPAGTENNGRYDVGEPYLDTGLDGVSGTPQQPATGWQQPGNGYDVGEGDGLFTLTSGLQNLFKHDAESLVRQRVAPVNVALDDAALARLDVWLDSGLRDRFNAVAAARRLLGAWASRGRFATIRTALGAFEPAGLPGAVLQQFGAEAPTPATLDSSIGQDPGSELPARISAATTFVTSRWAGHPELRWLAEPSSFSPASGAAACEVSGRCTLSFTSTSGRTAPVTVVLPPGYAHSGLQSVRYPVIYVLHGSTQSLDDAEAAFAQTTARWDDAQLSGSHRLAKAIVVFVDGRCRPNADGSSECLHGNFYADSPHTGGAQAETWLLELIGYVDGHYRTLTPEDVLWGE